MRPATTASTIVPASVMVPRTVSNGTAEMDDSMLPCAPESGDAAVVMSPLACESAV